MSFKKRIKAFFRFAWKSMKKATKIGGDIIFATSTPLTIAIPALYASKKNKIPMIFEVRDLWPEGPIRIGVLKDPFSIAAAKCLERAAYYSSEHVIALSPDMKIGVVKTGYPKEKVTIIPNSSDIELFRIPIEEGQSFLNDHPYLATGPLVRYVGALGLIKGVDYLVEIADEMLKLDPLVRFLVVGDGREKERIRSRASETKVLERNLWMLPPIPKYKVPTVLSASTVTTSLVIESVSNKPQSANKVFDAFAAGKPLMINHSGWLSKILRESGAGLVVPPRDAYSAARQLHSFLKNEKRLSQARIASALLADEQFNRDEHAIQLLEIFESTFSYFIGSNV
jgi:glycosyltransferase involved in cell wall biosynthesis